MYFHNFDLDSVVTPVKVDQFIELLEQSNYDLEETQFLKQGFTNGFDIGYEGPTNRKSTSENIPFTVGDNMDLWNKLMKEVKLGRVAGPFENVPFENFIQSPIGLVPKVGGEQTRLIFHLSYDFKRDGLKSVNFYMPKEKCSVKYRDLDYAANTYLDLCYEIFDKEHKSLMRESSIPASREQLKKTWRAQFHNHKRLQLVYAGKSNLKSAFRILGLSKSSWMWLVMKAQDPKIGEWKFFIDKCLPFGSSISCLHFQRFSDALCHLISFKLRLGSKKRITNTWMIFCSLQGRSFCVTL